MKQTRTPCKLSDSVSHKLNMYALAASAAGVGVLALAQPAEAKIVYTPTHHVIGPDSGYPLDLNHDGKADFSFVNRWVSLTTTQFLAGSLSILPAQAGNGIRGYGTVNKLGLVYFASALRAGTQIGPKGSFPSPKWVDWMFRASVAWGQWNDVKNRYLGFKFAIKGKDHYGWARLNVSYNPSNLKITGTLTGYAYETVPNKPIIAGRTKGPDVITVQPDSLGTLALGSTARRKERSIDAH